MDNLNEREKEILLSVIVSYTYYKKPISSRTLKKIYSMNISSATIRNIMSDLEDMGYLYQPHASSGRIPTEKGYRYYVDVLLKKKNLNISGEILKNISTRLGFTKNNIDRLISETSKVLAIFSKYLAIVMPVSIENMTLKRVELIEYNKNYIVCILITEEGVVNNKIIRFQNVTFPRSLKEIASLFNLRFKGWTIRNIKKELLERNETEVPDHVHLLESALQICNEVLNVDTYDTYSSGRIAGTSNLSEYVSPEQLKEIYSALENRAFMLKLLNRVISLEGVQVLIGSEIISKRMDGMSFVASTYKDRFHPIGTIGVIGPTMMNYEKVIPIVAHTAKTLTNIFSNL